MWGPGDGGAAGAQNGADELIAFYDQGWLDKYGDAALPWDQPWYVLRDLDGANFAIVDTREAASGQNAQLLRLAAEWRYDAYGSVHWSRIHGPHPVLTCGHRGVFFDRLDEPVIRFAAEAASGDAVSAAPALGQSWDTRVLVEPQVAGVGFDLPTGTPKIIGHIRNREYLPHLMRFAQRDPNATGQLVMAAVRLSGKAMANSASAMDLMELYGDGASLYAYLGGNPRGRADATGLSWDPFDAVDEMVAEHAASRAAFMETISRGFNAGASIAMHIAQLHPGLNILISAGTLVAGVSPEEVLLDFVVGYASGKAINAGVAAISRMRAMYRSARAMGSGSSMYEHVGKIGTYDKMSKLTAGWDLEIQAHHFVEKRHLKTWGMSVAETPAVILTKLEHQAVSRTLQRLLFIKSRVTYTKQDVRNAYELAYNAHPEWLEHVRKALQ